MREMNEDEGKEYQRLAAVIALHFARRGGMDDRTVSSIEEEIEAMRRRQRQLKGANFPALAVLVFPKLGAIDIVNRDIDRRGIETVIVNLTKKYPSITPEDIAFGVGRAFPEWRKMADAAHRNKRWRRPALLV